MHAVQSIATKHSYVETKLGIVEREANRPMIDIIGDGVNEHGLLHQPQTVRRGGPSHWRYTHI